MDELIKCGIRKPDDGRGYSRAFCENIGRLEALERGDKVRVWYAGAYRVVRVNTRIPGGCYWASLDRPLGGASRLVVTSGNFGGRVND